MQSSLQQYMHTLLLSKSQADYFKLTLIVDNARLLAPPPPPKVVDKKRSSRRDLFFKSVSDRSIFQKVRHDCRWTPEWLPPPAMPTRKMTAAAAIALTEPQESRWNNPTQVPPATTRRPREKGFYVRQSSDSVLIQPERRTSSHSRCS
jgi:hypothetical protein